MGRAAKNPVQTVSPVASKKQLLRSDGVCQFLGGISRDSFQTIRDDKDLDFPRPLQVLSGTQFWSVDQLERFVAREEKKIEHLTA